MARKPRTGRPGSSTAQGRTTRELILDAAERRFAEHGYAGVAVREIAADAGLKNQASLYHHFKNKRAIYEAVLARCVEPLVEIIASTSERPGAPDESNLEPAVAEEMVARMLDHLAQRPNLPRLLQRAGLDESRDLRRTITRQMMPLYHTGMELLAGHETPWKKAELPHLAAGFYNLIFGYFADAAVFEGVVRTDLRSPRAIVRQRRFLRSVARRLMGPAPRPSLPS